MLDDEESFDSDLAEHTTENSESLHNTSARSDGFCMWVSFVSQNQASFLGSCPSLIYADKMLGSVFDIQSRARAPLRG